jgi:hypothetical protein
MRATRTRANASSGTSAIMRDLEEASAIVDAAQRYPKLNALQHEALEAAQTQAARYAHVNELAEELVRAANHQRDHLNATRQRCIAPSLLQRRPNNGEGLRPNREGRPASRMSMSSYSQVLVAAGSASFSRLVMSAPPRSRPPGIPAVDGSSALARILRAFEHTRRRRRSRTRTGR